MNSLCNLPDVLEISVIGLVATIFSFIMNRENELGLQDHNTVLNSLLKTRPIYECQINSLKLVVYYHESIK
jgi:hypothetical protein